MYTYITHMYIYVYIYMYVYSHTHEYLHTLCLSRSLTLFHTHTQTGRWTSARAAIRMYEAASTAGKAEDSMRVKILLAMLQLLSDDHWIVRQEALNAMGRFANFKDILVVTRATSLLRHQVVCCLWRLVVGGWLGGCVVLSLLLHTHARHTHTRTYVYAQTNTPTHTITRAHTHTHPHRSRTCAKWL